MGRPCRVRGAALGAGAAHAGRPLQTEDAGVIERGACELEGFVQRQSADAEPSVRVGSLQLSCGLPANTQLGVQFQREHASGEHGDSWGVVGKTALVPLAADSAGLTLAYGMRARCAASGSSLRYADHFLNLVATVPTGPWLLHGNLGTAHDHLARLDSTTWAALSAPASVGCDAMAEVYGDDRAAPWWNLGLRYTAIAARLFLDASYGRQIDSARARLVSVGFK